MPSFMSVRMQNFLHSGESELSKMTADTQTRGRFERPLSVAKSRRVDDGTVPVSALPVSVHRFESGGIKLALDVNSGSIFSIDDLVWDILDYGESFGWDKVISGLAGKYSDIDLQEGLSEVNQLIEDERMYSSFKEPITSHGEPVIKAICLFASGICNLNCRYCFLFEDIPKSQQSTLLDTNIGKKALDFLVSKSGKRTNLEVDFFGGEPLLNLGTVKEVVSYGRLLEKQSGKKFKFTITTNGLLLDDDAIAFINSEFENVVVSIDGRPEVHDKMRKLPDHSGSYDRILENTRKLVKSRGDRSYYIRGTFTRHNLDFDEDAIHLSECGFRHISLEPVVLVKNTDYNLREEDLPAIFDSYERLARKCSAQKSNGHDFNFFHFQVDLEQGPCVAKRVTGCGAGNEYVAITPEGDIYPCHQFVGDLSFLMGNVTLGTFDSSMQERFGENSILAKEDCKKCWARFYCGGGCPANAYHFNGDIAKPYGLGCAIEKKRLEYALMLNTTAINA